MDEDGRQVYGRDENGKHEEKVGKSKHVSMPRLSVKALQYFFFCLNIIF